MFKYVYFALFVIILLMIFQAGKIYNKRRNKIINLGYLIFAFPMVIAFTMNPSEISNDIVAKKGINISLSSDFSGSNSDYTGNLDNADASGFTNILQTVYSDLNSMMGKEVTISGFIHREEDFTQNQVLISRLLISCCAADAQIAGVLCEYEGEPMIEGLWYEISGTIDSTLYYSIYTAKEELIPVIKVTEYREIPKPDYEYIFPQ
jgi:putative membrane protein